MTSVDSDSLRWSSSVLKILSRVNLVAGVLIFALLVGSIVAESWVMTALGVRPQSGDATPFTRIRIIMVIGIGTVAIIHVLLGRLRAIVATVSAGDPFVLANADRLKVIAWATLGLEAMHVVGGAVAMSVSQPGESLHTGWGFSLTRLVAVLLLFVLARVFEQGARMREDLEGTV